MKILFLPNWKVEYCTKPPIDKQPPDYYVKGQNYWFFRYFDDNPEVDVLDIRSFAALERFERDKIRFYIYQAIRAIPRLNKYDVVVSHGMQSGVVVSLWRRLFKTKAKHIVFDIGSFNSASESGMALKLMQFASKSIDGLIYHTGSQLDYYKKFFPWLVDKSRFLRFGTDADYFKSDGSKASDEKPYCVCVGYSKRDWDTLIKAFQIADQENLTLKLIGHVEDKYKGINNIEQVERIPIQELIREIENSRFGILPLKSFNYSYGQMTLLQQMALGKCVIASRVPSLVDYAEDGSTAVFYEPEDAQDLSRKIVMINTNSELIHSIGQNARAFVQDECNEILMAQGIEEFLNYITKE